MARLALAALVFVLLGAPAAAPEPAPRPEIRALWVDAFHAGIRSAAEVQQLVADARRLHVNTLFVQVRRRGDALYAGGLEPPVEDAAYDPAFDALDAILREAHSAGIQVHAWMNAMPIWRDAAPPRDARHVFNLHGPAAPPGENWLTRSGAGGERFPVGYFLDPGHPGAREHLVSVYLDVVRRYPVDGIHFDYIRYPETEGRLARGADVGYNAVSLARFARATGMARVPAPDDPSWISWRRQQVTELVRRISVEARAINPAIKVSAAVIAWGEPPKKPGGFEQASPMQRVFQDWQAWLKEGLLDLAAPMNYARERDERVRAWYDGWIGWEKRNKHGRQLVVGIGGYLSDAPGVLAQLARAREGRGRRSVDGVSIFSYASPRAAAAGTPSAPPPAGAPPAPPAPDRLDFLVEGVPSTPGAFRGPATVPPMPWLERPTRGYLAGTVMDASGAPLDGVKVRIVHRRLFGGTRRVVTDANGWFGLTNVKPGRYGVEIEGGPAAPTRAEVRVLAGRVVRVPARVVTRSAGR